MKSTAMSREWTEVFAGPSWKVDLLRSELEQADIVCFIPDSNRKRIGPFSPLGGNTFDFKLLVPVAQAAHAAEIVGVPWAEQYETRPAESLSDPRVDATIALLEQKGRRIRWSALVLAFAPYGVWLALSYVPAAAARSPRPASHRWTLFASVMCCVETALWVFAASQLLRMREFEALFHFLTP